jgi:DNA-binding response OmpR family regulator
MLAGKPDSGNDVLSGVADTAGGNAGMADIIVVDDEKDLASMIADYLQALGHRLRVAFDGVGLREAMAAASADLVVLDLNMPGENGLSPARWLREHHDAGILMLTGADTAFDRVAGLEVGADDYLSKPFALAELEARIATVLRRRRPKIAIGAPALAAGCLAFGSYVFDPNARSLVDMRGALVPLTPMDSTLCRSSRHIRVRF